MERLQPLANRLAGVLPSEWCQALYLTASAGVLTVQLLPHDASRALMDYGARAPADKMTASTSANIRLGLWLVWIMNFIQVPHSWFWHFYAVSIAWSVFWAAQFVWQGSLMTMLTTWQRDTSSKPASTDMGRVALAWAMMAVQGLRRLYESLQVAKPGSSPMSVSHWTLGLLFYTVTAMSVWIEGSCTCSAILPIPFLYTSGRRWLDTGQLTKTDAILTTRDHLSSSLVSALKNHTTAVGLMLFAYSSWNQNKCHRHLAGLKKYTLPIEGWFRYIICPHYFCECLIYVGISMVAAPQDHLFNKTVMSGLVFVAVNLGVTAHRTKAWYASKFGLDAVERRSKMIPWLF